MHNVFFQKQALVFKKGFMQTALIADRWKELLEEVTNCWLILQLDGPQSSEAPQPFRGP